MKPLKIAVFHPRFDEVGGAELFIIKMSAELRKIGHTVDVYGVRVNPTFKEVKQLSNLSSSRIFYNSTLDFIGVNLLGFSFLRILKKEKYDIINPHHYPAPFISVLLKKLGFTRAKIIWMCHEPMRLLYDKDKSHWGVSEFGGKVIYYLLSPFRWIDKWSIKNVDAIVSNSNSTQAKVKEIYKRDSYIVNPGVDPDIFDPSKVVCDKYLTDKKCLLAVGRLRTRKNFDFLLRVFKKIIDISPDVVLRIVGEGPEKENLIRLIQSLNLEEHMELLSNVPQKDLVKLYKVCNLLVHPTKYEPWGMVILEAMAMGKPVVAISSSGPKEIIINGQTGYLVDFSPNGFAEKIIDLLDSPQKAGKMGEEGRKRVLSNFSCEKSARKMEEVFYKTQGQRQ